MGDAKFATLTPWTPAADVKRVHSTFSQTASPTGRITTEMPNLQAVAKEIPKATVGVTKWRAQASLQELSLEYLTSLANPPNTFVGVLGDQYNTLTTSLPDISQMSCFGRLVDVIAETETEHSSTRRKVILERYSEGQPLRFEEFANQVYFFAHSPPPPEPSAHYDILCLRNVLSARPGYVLLSADYAEMELRLFAHLSGDEILLSLIHQGGDVFKAMASKWLKKAESDISPEDRQKCKGVFYCILYGGGPFRVASDLGIEVDQARTMIANLKSSFPGIEQFIEATLARCKKSGFVTSIQGRKRYLHSIHSHLRHEQSRAERQAVNTVCQSSAADVIKMAQLRARELISAIHVFAECAADESTQPVSAAELPKWEPLCGMGVCSSCGRCGALVVLQIHDELLFEVPQNHVPEVQAALSVAMEQMLELKVPLIARFKCAPRWGQVSELLPGPTKLVFEDSETREMFL
eukprot:c9284_g1_i1.p1 GENE.c9284_g1_i1~~c9284_g1_i1.p1  ORF type:complete len:466 (+),score=91.36 c9284_g1_i1:1-1398(+)